MQPGENMSRRMRQQMKQDLAQGDAALDELVQTWRGMPTATSVEVRTAMLINSLKAAGVDRGSAILLALAACRLSDAEAESNPVLS